MGQYDYELSTFRDAVEHVLDGVVGGDASERNLRRARLAVLEAYRALPTARDWRYFRRRVRFASEASHATGTLTYDHTGGAFERLVTFSSATLPTNARFYKLKIGDAVYDVEDRKSSSTLTLTEATNPGADVAAGTAYTLYRDTYPLQFDFGDIDELLDATTDRELAYVESPLLLAETTRLGTTQDPYLYTVIGNSQQYRGGMAVQFAPPPNAVRQYVADCRLRPRPLVEELHQEGSVELTADSATVTGVGTFWASRHVGSVFRVATDTNNPPTPVAGSIEGYHNPFDHQSVIKAVASATSLTLETAPTVAFAAGCKYTISDPIDLEAGAMLTYFLRLAESHFARLEGRKDAEEREAAALRELARAAYADVRRKRPDSPQSPVETLADMADQVGP